MNLWILLFRTIVGAHAEYILYTVYCWFICGSHRKKQSAIGLSGINSSLKLSSHFFQVGLVRLQFLHKYPTDGV